MSSLLALRRLIMVIKLRFKRLDKSAVYRKQASKGIDLFPPTEIQLLFAINCDVSMTNGFM